MSPSRSLLSNCSTGALFFRQTDVGMLTRNLIALLLLAFAVAAIADPPSGVIGDSNDLAKAARLVVRYLDGDKSVLDDKESLESVRAMQNYLKGFGDCNVITEASTKASCPFLLPKENDANQLVRVVDKYIGDHPEKMNEPPGIIVWNAFVQAFPNKDFKQPDIKP